MPRSVGKVLVCSCEGTMPLDVEAIGRGCGTEIAVARHLCRAEIERFKAVADGPGALTVGCTQEAPLFSDLMADKDRSIIYVNIRETAGWSKDADGAGPKMAALIAAAHEPLPDVPVVTLESEGVILIYGCGERAVEA